MSATFADMLSVPTEFEHDGKAYRVRPPNQLEQGEFQRWLEYEADCAIDRKTWLSDEQRLAEKAVLNRAIAAGEFEWGGEVSVRRLATLTGISKLLQIICRISKEEADAVSEARLKLVVGLVRGAQARDPKAVREALTQLGLPPNFLDSKDRHSSGSETRRSASRKRKSKR